MWQSFKVVALLPVCSSRHTTWLLMLLAVTIDSSRIHSLFTSPGNRALALLSSLFSKAFQELSRSRYVSVFEAAAGNALWVKNIFLFRVPRYFWPGNEIRPFVWAPPFHNLCVCRPISIHITTGWRPEESGFNRCGKYERQAIQRSPWGEGLCKLMCINWWITDLLVRRRQKMQTPWVFFGFYMLVCPLRTTVLKGSHQPWGEVGLMRWSFSQFHCTRQHSWKIPITAPYSCLHKCSLQCVLALLWTIPGLGFNHFIGSLFPFPTGLLVGFFPAPLSSLFHSLFPAEEPLTAWSQAHFSYFSLWTVLPFSIQCFCRAARTGGIVSAVPHCKHQCM